MSIANKEELKKKTVKKQQKESEKGVYKVFLRNVNGARVYAGKLQDRKLEM